MSPRPAAAPSLQIPQNPYIVPAGVPLPPRESWPSMYDLPSEDPEEPGLPDEFHDFQPQLLSATFRLADVATNRIFTAADLNLYYDITHPRWYKRPDWFAVVGVSRFYENRDLRLSYVTWQEQVNPDLVVELLSPGTAEEDLGQTIVTNPNSPPPKWQVYEQILRIPYYVVFDRYTGHLQAFRLGNAGYQPITIVNGRFTMPELGLGLGLWCGEFQGFVRDWLRFFDSTGQWILTPEEAVQQRVEQAQQRAEQAQQRAEQAQQRAERLADLLRAQGIDPDQLV